MLNKYFFTHGHCIFVKEKASGAIYNLATGDILSLTNGMDLMLYWAEQGKNIREISQIMSKDCEEIESFFRDLAARGVGRFYNKKIFIYKRVSHDLSLSDFITPPPLISRLYIELPSPCERDCSFCDSLKLYPCIMCSKTNERTPRIKPLIKPLMNFLEAIVHLDCKNIVFHGGNPLLLADTLMRLIGFCRKHGFPGTISIITNGRGLNADLLEIFSRSNVHLFIPYVGTWNELSQIAKSLHCKGISYSVVCVIENQKVDRYRNEGKRLAALGGGILKTFIVNKSIDRPPGNVGDHMIRVTSRVFYHNMEHHPCLDGVIAVSAEGYVHPCPFLKNEVLGHISDSDIVNIIFEDRLIDKYWKLNLSKILPCRDCAFRFGCLDCRATEQVLSGSLYEKRLCPKFKIGENT